MDETILTVRVGSPIREHKRKVSPVSDQAKNADVKLEDQYQPLGLKAVKAAAELSSQCLEAGKEKPKKQVDDSKFVY